MEIVKVNKFELKELEKTPIWEERTTLTVPFVVINSNNEVLFGKNSIDNNADSEGNVECVKLDISDNIESRKVAFHLHYLGMTCVIGFENFNDLSINQTGGPYDLYLWNASQFEKTYGKKVKEELIYESSLF